MRIISKMIKNLVAFAVAFITVASVSISTPINRYDVMADEEIISEVDNSDTGVASLVSSSTADTAPKKVESKTKSVTEEVTEPVTEEVTENSEVENSEVENLETEVYEDSTDDVYIESEDNASNAVTDTYNWDGSVLTQSSGINYGPSGLETYYNLPMDGVVSIMRNAGFSEEEYPYWESPEGYKMLGNYIMVAADLSIRPRGTTIETSLGMGLVCDTGSFIYNNPEQLDIAVNW